MAPGDSRAGAGREGGPVTVIVVGATVQSESVGVGAPTGTLNIFSMSICAITVELLCWRFLELLPIARGINAAIASTPTSSTTQAIIISIRDIPRWLVCDARMEDLFLIGNSIANHSS